MRDAVESFGSGPLRTTMRRYGPTVHLLLAGEADLQAERTFDEVCARLPRDADVVACDLHDVSLMDVAGLHALIALRRFGRRRGATVLVYNWPPQPLRLLRALNCLDDPCDDDLRALREILGAHRGPAHPRHHRRPCRGRPGRRPGTPAVPSGP
ncbi:STAS domain-containing protein [Streptomyces sp. NPDC051109]|uniref:STAS domain-containing protein n=1 Tax=Streptomyces sp. NPDC051109 TaxID=3365642 RepID=UPI001417031E